jgi:predicted PurR-regulated permease PerM
VGAVSEAFRVVWANPYVKVGVGLLMAVLVIWAFLAARPATTLFVAAYGLAYVLNPVVDLLQARGARRGFGVALIAVALAAIVWFASSLSFAAVSAALTPTEDGVTLSETVTVWFETLPENLERLLPGPLYAVIAGPLGTLGALLDRAAEALAPHFQELTEALYAIVSGTVSGVVQVVLVLVLTVYVLFDFHRFNASLLAVWPVPYQKTVTALATTLDQAMGGYIRGQLLIAAFVGLMVFAGLTLLGLPLAGLIALLAGVFNLVPFLGTIVPVIPALAIAIAGGWLQVLLVLVIFVVANQIAVRRPLGLVVVGEAVVVGAGPARRRGLVDDHLAVRVQLQRGGADARGDRALGRARQHLGLRGPGDDEQHLARLEDGADAHRQRPRRDGLGVAAEHRRRSGPASSASAPSRGSAT